MSIMLLILSVISIFIFSFYDSKKIKEFIIKNEKKIINRKIFKYIMTTNKEKGQIENVNNNLIRIKIKLIKLLEIKSDLVTILKITTKVLIIRIKYWKEKKV